jgi:peptidoglycan hydrolase-like protein with peptidoglycan-binding domain
MQGEDVKQLQIYLNSKGYDVGVPDGVFGTKSKQAVILFQKAHNLTADGAVGPGTRGRME